MIKNLENSLTKYFSYFEVFYIIFTAVFSRTGAGFKIFSFRLGEIAVGLAILYCVMSIFLFNSKFRYKRIKISLFIMVFTFFITNLLFNSSFTNLYIYRSSTYIWFFSFLFIGTYAKKIEINKNFDKYFYFLFIYIYVLGIFNTEGILSNFLKDYSDKVEFHKGSEILLLFVCFFFLKNNFRERNLETYFIFLFFSSLYAPFLMYKSRASFISLVFFVIFELFLFYKKINIQKKTIIISLLIILIIGTLSTILSQNYLIPDYESFPELIKSSYSNIVTDRYKTYDTELPFIYIENGRIFTADGNLNWRLQMWQDMISFISNNLQYSILGIGYQDSFPVFDINLFEDAKYRLGLDGINEHLHNFFLTIFARGGVIHLACVLYIFLLIYQEYIKRYKDKKILILLFCVFFVSFFDSSMENAHFPIIFYFYIGNQLINKSKL